MEIRKNKWVNKMEIRKNNLMKNDKAIKNFRPLIISNNILSYYVWTY